MVKSINRLTTREIERLRKPGMYPDGGGLYVSITKAGVKSFSFRYMLKGRARTMGLGPTAKITLAEARQAADDARKLLAQTPPTDPIDSRKAERIAEATTKAKTVTFRQSAEDYIDAKTAGWKSKKHAAQWRSTLETYVYPTIGNVLVGAVDTPLILKIIRPIWAGKTETASRVRQRIESILDGAKAQGQRDGENPARWRGHLSQLLPHPRKVKKVKHHAALDYRRLPQFMTELRAIKTETARALEFLILTAARTNEVTAAVWAEIDTTERVWTIPAERMKAGRPHRVPLSDGTMKIIAEMQALGLRHVFPGRKRAAALSNAAMDRLLKRMKYDDCTVHGMRATFKTFSMERTNFAHETSEAALAHIGGDTVERASDGTYSRTDLFDKRRRLMETWDQYCSHGIESAEVIPIRA